MLFIRRCRAPRLGGRNEGDELLKHSDLDTPKGYTLFLVCLPFGTTESVHVGRTQESTLVLGKNDSSKDGELVRALISPARRRLPCETRKEKYLTTFQMTPALPTCWVRVCQWMIDDEGFDTLAISQNVRLRGIRASRTDYEYPWSSVSSGDECQEFVDADSVMMSVTVCSVTC